MIARMVIVGEIANLTIDNMSSDFGDMVAALLFILQTVSALLPANKVQ